MNTHIHAHTWYTNLNATPAHGQFYAFLSPCFIPVRNVPSQIPGPPRPIALAHAPHVQPANWFFLLHEPSWANCNSLVGQMGHQWAVLQWWKSPHSNAIANYISIPWDSWSHGLGGFRFVPVCILRSVDIYFCRICPPFLKEKHFTYYSYCMHKPLNSKHKWTVIISSQAVKPLAKCYHYEEWIVPHCIRLAGWWHEYTNKSAHLTMKKNKFLFNYSHFSAEERGFIWQIASIQSSALAGHHPGSIPGLAGR